MKKNIIPPIHPGEILLEEFLYPMGVSQYRLSKDINVPAVRINDRIFFGMSVEFWAGIQSEYEVAMAKNRIEDRLDREIRPYKAA
jgi:plasmid maintenance system antidote protein VapI